MRYELRVTAFDVLDSVHIALVVYAASDIPQASQQVVLRSTTGVRGTGELDPSRWATDALVAALETL